MEKNLNNHHQQSQIHHQYYQPQSPLSMATTPVSYSDLRRAKRRGNYMCGRCGQPKKGHSCNTNITDTTSSNNNNNHGGGGGGNTVAVAVATPSTADSSILSTPLHPRNPPPFHLRRALSFDDVVDDNESGSDDNHKDFENDVEVNHNLHHLKYPHPYRPHQQSQKYYQDHKTPQQLEQKQLQKHPGVADVPGMTVKEFRNAGFPGGSCLWEVLRRLPPPALLSAAKVCKGWRDCSRKIWKSAEELRLRVPVRAKVWFIGSVLQKCTGLLRLSLTMQSDVDSTMFACIAFSCPNLQSMEIRTTDKAINRITGDELSRFVADKLSLTSLKIEGCSNLGSLTLSSSSLSTLWISDLYCLSKMVFNCPNLKELSLDFARQENDSTDLTTMVDSLGRTCPNLQNIHIASLRLSHDAVLALTAANMSYLRMLSLILGSGITDASVASITSTYPDLELLDLSGSSISDSGIGMICNELSESLCRLLLALCPNITSSGIQFAAAQLPHLELMDCGMTLCDPKLEDVNANKSSIREYNKDGKPNCLLELSNIKPHVMNQKLIIKHASLKKLSLWGCSGLDALYLNCPGLNDLNLTSCTNLQPERLLLQCPNLESVHASGCKETLVGAIQSQVCNDFASLDDIFPCKRMADGSKRVRVPNFDPQEPEFEKKKKVRRQQCSVHVK
ncbi:hypothetical protein MKW94_012350 [Papaver nudicaule]|uniref:F-box domain-containing protein n=1 Tax=Papaver nudicaule TaxID=74823 RepID=A0AA42AZZ7_PAPNU|nr:hypothetical protein [Papaver nudicaule]